MDTGSHLLFGATLAGLAALQPEVAHSPVLAHAVLTATLLGSHAPDFDSFIRLKSYAAYVRHHRGLTHSLPAVAVWPFALGVPIALLFGVWAQLTTVVLWAMAAVVFHIALDWLNAYGVQCFRPLSRRWHHLDVLALFEPPLFALHGAGLLLWAFGAVRPGPVFLAVYALTFVYIAIRGWQHACIVSKVKRSLGQDGVCHIVPSLWLFHWQFYEAEYCFYNGTVRNGRVEVRDVFAKERNHPAIQATLGTDGVRAFLHFAQRVHVKLTERHDGYVVQWRDMRFWYNHKLPFGVDVKLDRELNVVSDTLGWTKKAWDPPYV
ncbi:hydrolase [Gordoniibacillus kamchatkensis]|uniref:Hydrolase n=1 Tax=Gordoniibacillus kamchatkensis TaxID=1590651 RepID=A0ABR5AHC9_9BACL|nr:metal-dependent hydrolase [Paenibacillus sp. VKM B-2647]KIL40158.1 hydrolase [Paenibacillus sp. VKM B-2647]